MTLNKRVVFSYLSNHGQHREIIPYLFKLLLQHSPTHQNLLFLTVDDTKRQSSVTITRLYCLVFDDNDRHIHQAGVSAVPFFGGDEISRSGQGFVAHSVFGQDGFNLLFRHCSIPLSHIVRESPRTAFDPVKTLYLTNIRHGLTAFTVT